jgi:hypothetical protein
MFLSCNSVMNILSWDSIFDRNKRREKSLIQKEQMVLVGLELVVLVHKEVMGLPLF